MKRLIVSALAALLLMPALAEVTISTEKQEIPLYTRIEFECSPGFAPRNPYDYTGFDIKGVFIHESGKRYEVDAFYSQKFEFDGEDKYTPGDFGFRIRFAPKLEGAWKVYAEARQKNGDSQRSNELAFRCAGRERKGFLKVSDADNLFLEHDNKEPFFGRGMNMCWSTGKVYKDYFRWLETFLLNGGNFIRLWMANWSFGIEWDGDIGNYAARQKQAYMLDQVVELCEAGDVYYMLCLVPHGEYSSKINPNWDRNPYSAANDGILETPDEFFTNEAAKKAFKNRLRYIIARWGSSPNLAAWELFNEVDLTDNYDDDRVAAWHSEMFNYIKERDPYRHLLTTSFSDANKGEKIWKMGNCSFTQTHMYGLVDTAEQLYEASRRKIEAFQKPHIVSEFGISADAALEGKGADNSGVSLHNALWGASFCLNFGSPMIWWWDSYIDKNGLFAVYSPFSKFVERISWARGDFYELRDIKAYYKNPEGKRPGDAAIAPIDSWSRPSRSRFIVMNNGRVTDADKFVAFLFGSAHPDMQNPPVIVVRNARPGKLLIRTAAVSDESNLAVKVNGREALSVSISAKDLPGAVFKEEWKIYQAQANLEYSVDLPVGENEVELLNTGTDWIKLEKITLTEITDPALAPVFITGIISEKSAYIYIKNKAFNWQNQSPGEIDVSAIAFAGLSKGRYVIQYVDTFTGAVVIEREDILDADEMKLELPVFSKDMAIRIERYRKKED